MLRKCVTLAALGCVLAGPAPRAQQYHVQQQQQAEIPPHLLRQYLAAQQLAPAQTQVIARPQPAPARHPYQVQAEPQYQQYQPAPQQYRPQPQPQPQPQYRPQPQYQPARQQETREPEDYDPNPSYQFGFDVNDDQYTNYQNRKEQRDGDVIKGSYSVVDSDGFIRTVTYTADPKEGFKAEVSREPTDIVVKIPTPKPQLQSIQPQAQAHPQQQVHHQQQVHPQQQVLHQQQVHPQQQAPQQYYRYQQQ